MSHPNPTHDVEADLKIATNGINNQFWFLDITRLLAFFLFQPWLKAIIREFDRPINPADPAFPDEVYLKALAVLFGHIIFGVNLAGRVEVQWGVGRPGQPLGVTVMVEGGRSGIKLNSTAINSWELIVTTLLHELCHCYNDLFICQDRPATGEYCGSLYHRGQSGHGWVFQKLALTVEEFGARLFEKEDLDIGRVEGIASEFLETGQVLSMDYLMQFFNEEQRNEVREFARGE